MGFPTFSDHGGPKTTPNPLRDTQTPRSTWVDTSDPRTQRTIDRDTKRPIAITGTR